MWYQNVVVGKQWCWLALENELHVRYKQLENSEFNKTSKAFDSSKILLILLFNVFHEISNNMKL